MKFSTITTIPIVVFYLNASIVLAAMVSDTAPVDPFSANEAISELEGPEDGSDINTVQFEENLPHTRNRRQLFPAELNPKIGGIIRSLDENDCIGRFFCELGCDTKIFGPLGELVNTAMMFINHKDTMAAKPYKIGQELGMDGCTMKCDSNMLHKIIRYANRQLFTKPSKTRGRH